MRFFLGMIFGILLVAVLAAAIVFTGSFNVSAIVPPSKAERRLATFALDRSVSRRATNQENPLPMNAETLRGGLHEFGENCVVCHGAPGVDPGAIGQGLNPGAPDLTLPRVQARSDGELFWITSNGIRMTGMPAFSPTHDEKEIWEMVAFIRHLPEITDEETARLKEEAGSEAEGEEREGGTPGPGETPGLTPPTPRAD